jgi:hypothetical protein
MSMPRRLPLQQRPSPHTKIILPLLLLLLLLVLDACTPAEDEKRQVTAVDGNVAWSELGFHILHEEVNEGTDEHTTIVGVVLLWCVCCAGDEHPGVPVREWGAFAFQVFVLQIAKDGIEVVVVVVAAHRIIKPDGFLWASG